MQNPSKIAKLLSFNLLNTLAMATERITDKYPAQPFNDDNIRHIPVPIRTVKQIGYEAQMHKHWIYDPRTKDWFSPSEFIDKYGRTPSNQDFLNQLQIRDPADGIKAGYKAVQKYRPNWKISRSG